MSVSRSVGLTERLAAASARRPRRTIGLWGLAIVVALVLTGSLLHGLTTTSRVVGTPESVQAMKLYAQAFPSTVADRSTDVVVVASKHEDVTSPGYHAFVSTLSSHLHADGVRVIQDDLFPGSALVSKDGHAAMVLLRLQKSSTIKAVERTVVAANNSKGFQVAVTGTNAVNNDFSKLSTSDLEHGELEFGLPAALIVLALVFGAVVAGLIPVLMAGLVILVGLGLAALLSLEFSLSIFIVNMMTGMGLALGIDYSLFIVSRYREERGNGFEKQTAIRIAGATASRAVLFSGSTFVVALFGLLIVPTTILRSLAAGAIIVGIVSVAAALTLLPALLSLLGDRVNAGKIPVVGRNLGRRDTAEGRFWRSIISRVLKHPGLSFGVACGAMLVLASPFLGLHIGQSGVATLPNSAPSKQGYLAVSRYFPGANPSPVEIVVRSDSGRAIADLSNLQTELAHNPSFGHGTIQRSTRTAVLGLTVPIAGDPVSSSAIDAVRELRATIIPHVFEGSGAVVLVGGQTALTLDYFNAVSHATPYVLAFVLGLSFILLTIAFRSLVVAAVSILLNLLSVGAAYGLLTLVFEHGIGAGILGFQKVTAIDAWVPLFLFSVLFALSMDYQVFLMSRIKERYDQGGSTREAVSGGVTTTARIITGAALIIVVVFAGFARGQLVMFQQMGFGVAIALLLDATVIRSVILPSLLVLLDDRTWFLPSWLDWLPHVQVEHRQSPSDQSVTTIPTTVA